jgi:hypothetical protein
MRRILLVSALLSACAPGFDIPNLAPNEIATAIEPFGSVEGAPEVLRLRLDGALGRSALHDFRLFEGDLSDYHLGRVRARELPKTLLEREVPLVVWAEPKAVVAAPVRVLASGRHSLVTPELGLVAAFEVVPSGLPRLERLWPSDDSASSSGLAIYCGDGAPLVSFGSVTLAPSGVLAELAAGLDERGLFSRECVRLSAAPSAVPLPENALLLPPLLAAGAALEPVPLIARRADVPPPSCEGAEFPLGPACALIDDDRLTLRAASQASLWALEAPSTLLGIATPSASLVVRGLEPGKEARVRGRAFDSAGTTYDVDSSVTAAPRREHLVINEVLANPVGPEAKGEWVEIVNDGTTLVELEGFELLDSGGSARLPAGLLAPAEFALLVAAEFAPDPELDLPPAPGTRLLRLETLGKGGLANAGELLRLVNAEGAVLSRFPALPPPASGQSLARRSPASPDAEAASFGAHADPGASPGTENDLEPTR